MATTQWWFWIGFNAFIVLMLVLDLGVFHRKAHAVRLREALGWATFWISLGLLFSILIFFAYDRHWGGFGLPSVAYPQGLTGHQAVGMYLGSYVLEESLSVDNLFVFLLIFSYFAVPPHLQHRVLFWGILGAILMRATFILAAIELIEHFAWLLYIFGAFLVITGLRMAFKSDEEVHPERNFFLRLVRKLLPVTNQYEGTHFFVRHAGKLMATPMFVVLLVIESTDVVFAVDSIPAVIGITKDRFLAYTSNIFAILGLRAIFFALAGVMTIFHFLHYGLAVILVFVGVKMISLQVMETYFSIHPPIGLEVGVSLSVVVGILAASVLLSLIFPKAVPAVPPQTASQQTH